MALNSVPRDNGGAGTLDGPVALDEVVPVAGDELVDMMDDLTVDATVDMTVDEAGEVATPTTEAAAEAEFDRGLFAEMWRSIVLPGWVTYRRSPVLAVLLVLGGVALPIALVAWAMTQRGNLIGFALDEDVLLAVVVVGVLIVLTRLAAVLEVSHAHRGAPRLAWRTALALCVVLLLGAPSIWTVYHAARTREVVGEVFSAGSDEPLFVPLPTAGDVDVVADEGGEELPTGGDDEIGDGAEPDAVDEVGDGAEPAAADQGAAGGDESAGGGTDAVAVDPEAVTNILLLGGDAGPGRWGMRTDSMILFSLHEESGRTALISIPRNLRRLRFPPGSPLAEDYPNGFNDLANAVFTHVTTRDPSLLEAYGGERPEVVALAQGLGYSLDVRIDDYVLVNMVGFRDMIDAIGGVDIEVPKRVLLQKHNPTALYELPDAVGPGTIEMDGTLAIAYARARRGDSDYQRMGRQRELLTALGEQVSTVDAIKAFPSLSDALGDSLRTSLTAGEFNDLLNHVGDNVAIGESVGLTPPLIDPGSPDYAEIRSIVDAVERFVRFGEPSGYSS